jgi:hypothetical protein
MNGHPVPSPSGPHREAPANASRTPARFRSIGPPRLGGPVFWRCSKEGRPNQDDSCPFGTARFGRIDRSVGRAACARRWWTTEARKCALRWRTHWARRQSVCTLIGPMQPTRIALAATPYYLVEVMWAMLKRGLLGSGIWRWQGRRASPNVQNAIRRNGPGCRLPSLQPWNGQMLVWSLGAISWAEEARRL